MDLGYHTSLHSADCVKSTSAMKISLYFALNVQSGVCGDIAWCTNRDLNQAAMAGMPDLTGGATILTEGATERGSMAYKLVSSSCNKSNFQMVETKVLQCRFSVVT